MNPSKWQWKPMLALAVLAYATIYDLYWVWGLALLFWAGIDIYSGKTHLIETVSWKQNPVLFIAIELGWAGLAIYLILGSLYPV
ncbi:hypothetical protein KFE98_17000 [bacterium SCSIO 12741]|nr:hypothetical protein KFE98_17000 [bacterium SCSIO 12741]